MTPDAEALLRQFVAQADVLHLTAEDWALWHALVIADHRAGASTTGDDVRAWLMSHSSWRQVTVLHAVKRLELEYDHGRALLRQYDAMRQD